MLQKKHLVIVILVLYFYSVNCVNEKIFIGCDPTKESGEKASSDCPKNSKCVELGIKENLSTTGLCACMVNFTVNRNYSSSVNGSTYCIESNQSTQAPPTTAKPLITTTIKPTAAPIPLKTSSTTVAPTSLKPQTTKKTELTTPKPSVESPTKTTSDNDDKQHDKKQQSEEVKVVTAPQAHHILGGIIIPIMIVFAFIGVVYGIRKYDVLERTQNYIRSRRSGGQPHQTRYDGLENDFDDDPLLI